VIYFASLNICEAKHRLGLQLCQDNDAHATQASFCLSTTMKKTFSDEYEIIEHAIQRLMWMEQKKFAVLLSQHALTLPQFLVLALVHQHGVGCPIGKLAEEMFQSYPTMTGIVDRLKDAGLVARGDDPTDRRKVVVSLTREGRTLLDRARDTRRVRMARALGKLSTQDRREFLRLLTIYLETFEEENV
jgi:DNA-binding MarR family transcriptional regulator